MHRYWRILDWVDRVIDGFAGWFTGKASPVHLSWHSFDLAYTRFGGRPAPASLEADAVTRESYGQQVVSFGFWTGQPEMRYPAFTPTRRRSPRD